MGVVTSLAHQLKELGQLARNVSDAVAERRTELALEELADWVRTATSLIGQLAVEVREPDRNLTAPEGVEVHREG